MTTKTRRLFVVGLMSACVVTACAGASMFKKSAALADTQTETIASNYFYDNLKFGNSEFTLAKKFYEALDAIYESGDFKDGVVEYALNGGEGEEIVTQAELKAYVDNGDVTIPRAFGAARDAFLTDHPEIFYVDFYKLTISILQKGSEYFAYIDSGREENVYYENGGLDSESAVNAAITAFNAKVDALVEEANKAEEEDTYSERDVFLARYVSKALGKSIKYDYDAYEKRNDPDAQKTAQAHINTSYGGLVLETAVCGGYSRSYKVIMDKLGIPCITVNGYSKQRYSSDNPDSNVYHMWNYVWLENPTGGTAQAASKSDGKDGEWYSVDATWGKAVLNAAADAEQHINDGKISSSNYELKYPRLSSHVYGSSGSEFGLQHSIEYVPTNEKDDYGNTLVSNYSTVSYNGKGARKLLEEDGLYIALRFSDYKNGELQWTKWMALEPYRQLAIDLNGVHEADSFIQDFGNETRFYDNTSIYATQFAVFEFAPDVPQNIHSDSQGIDKTIYMQYTDKLVSENTALEMGDLQVNQSYGTYTPAPYVSRSKPSHTVEQVISDGMSMSMSGIDAGKMDEKYAQIYEITYDEPLHILDTKKEIGIDFVSDHPNAKEKARFLEFESENEPGKMVKVEIVQRAKNSGDSTLVYNTLRFKFAPSLMYRHNREGYFITFTNVGSAKEVSKKVDGVLTTVTSDKAPNPVYYSFGRLYMACPARFNYDGRLWVECCAQPTLVSNSDLSVDNFTDENGSTFSENERSQMMLVAEKAETATVDTMLDEISGDNNINVNKNEIKKSETYDIALQICGKYPQIPKGSYVKIALGFPDGYGPDDEGVTFKLFHRKNVGGDNYIIEEVPCVVTRFGIVATVTSFSPYMVAVVDAEKATDKTIYATIDGKGVKLLQEDGEVKSIKEGESCSYTIMRDEISDAGYRIYSVKLNGAEVKDRVGTDGKLTLSYADLQANNELEIQYIAEAAAARYETKAAAEGFEKVEPAKIYVQTNELYPVEDIAPDKNNTGLIVGIIVAVVAVLAAGVVVVLVLKKRNGGKQAAAAAEPVNSAKAEKAEKPAAPRSNKTTAQAAKQPVKQPAKLPAASAKPAAQPAKTSAQPAKPAKLPTVDAKPATQPAKQPNKLPTAKSVKQPEKLPTKKDK